MLFVLQLFAFLAEQRWDAKLHTKLKCVLRLFVCACLYHPGVALTALGRAHEACVALRNALKIIPVGSAGGSDLTSVTAALRKAATALPLSYVCDHWVRRCTLEPGLNPFEPV